MNRQESKDVHIVKTIRSVAPLDPQSQQSKQSTNDDLHAMLKSKTQ